MQSLSSLPTLHAHSRTNADIGLVGFSGMSSRLPHRTVLVIDKVATFTQTFLAYERLLPEGIAKQPNRVDDRGSKGFQLLSEIADIELDNVIGATKVVVPHLCTDFSLG